MRSTSRRFAALRAALEKIKVYLFFQQQKTKTQKKMNVARLQRQSVYLFDSNGRTRLSLENFKALCDAVANAAANAATNEATNNAVTNEATGNVSIANAATGNSSNSAAKVAKRDEYLFFSVLLTSSSNGSGNIHQAGDDDKPGNEKCNKLAVKPRSKRSTESRIKPSAAEPSTFVAPQQFAKSCASTVIGQLYAQVSRREQLDRQRFSTQNLPASWHASAHFKHDQMVQCVTLRKYRDAQLHQLEVSLFPSRAFKSSPNRAQRSLQHFLAFCLASVFQQHCGNDHKKESEQVVRNALTEQDLESLNLYSFAWLCSLLQTLRFFKLAQRLERVLVQNLEHFCHKYVDTTGKNEEKSNDYYFFVMFLGSLAARRLAPMRQLLQFMRLRNMIDDLRQMCARNSKSLTNAAGAVAPKSRATVVQETAQAILERIDSISCAQRNNNNVAAEKQPPARRDSLQRVSREKQAFRLLALVDVFVAWLSGIVAKTTEKQRQQGVQCFALFDDCVCWIECANDRTNNDARHRRYCVTRVGDKHNSHGEPRSAQFSVQDLNEWLRYMVLLQLDERNVHRETRFLLSVDSRVADFGRPPHLTFDGVGGILFLAFFLLHSEFLRASLYQRREEIRAKHSEMLSDAALQQYVKTDEPYTNFIVLSEALLAHAVTKYQLNTVQGVSLQSYKA